MSAVRLYLDDSGNKEYGPSTSRYFVYAGPIVDVEQERAIAKRFSDLKREVFGDAAVEIKSNWMRQPKERRSRYLQPYAVSEADFDAFVERWFDLMRSPDLTYLAGVIDKPQMLRDYGSNAWYPSAAAYQFVLQRYELQLRSIDVVGEVTIDDMSGSSPKHNHWRDLLRVQHQRLKRDGCQLTKLKFGHVADECRFGNSARFDLLQVADVAAYNVFRQFRDHGDEWDKADATTAPLYPWLARILPRFATSPDGIVEGWGVVKWPSARKSRWRVNFKEVAP